MQGVFESRDRLAVGRGIQDPGVQWLQGEVPGQVQSLDKDGGKR